jgi:hypothetical protein
MACGTAWADDFVVVRSTDASIVKGRSLSAGQSLQVAPGTKVTIISTSGELRTLTGGAGVAKVPQPGAAPSRPNTLEALRAMLQRPKPRPVTGAMRGVGDCPKVEDLKTLDQIIAAEEKKCTTVARLALDNYLSATAATPVALEEPAVAPVPTAEPAAPVVAPAPVPAAAPVAEQAGEKTKPKKKKRNSRSTAPASPS